MSFFPIVQSGVQGGSVTATVYTYIQELYTIPYRELITTTSAVNVQAEETTKRQKGPGTGH